MNIQSTLSSLLGECHAEEEVSWIEELRALMLRGIETAETLHTMRIIVRAVQRCASHLIALDVVLIM